MPVLIGLLRTMRPKQWTKNLLFVFPAIVFDGQLFDTDPFLRVMAAFVMLCLISGTVYIRFNASASGTITNVSARSHDVRDRDLLLCVRSRLSGVRLERGAVETYRVPLRLVPSE